MQNSLAYSSVRGSFLSSSVNREERYCVEIRLKVLVAVPSGRTGSSKTKGIANASKEETFDLLTFPVSSRSVYGRQPSVWSRAGWLLRSALARNIYHGCSPVRVHRKPQHQNQDLPLVSGRLKTSWSEVVTDDKELSLPAEDIRETCHGPCP